MIALAVITLIIFAIIAALLASRIRGDVGEVRTVVSDGQTWITSAGSANEGDDKE